MTLKIFSNEETNIYVPSSLSSNRNKLLCPFCSGVFSNLANHYSSAHKHEDAVLSILNEPDKERKRHKMNLLVLRGKNILFLPII